MKRLLVLLSLTAMSVTTAASSVNVITNSKSSVETMASTASAFNYDGGVRPLKEVLTSPNIGDIIIPSTVDSIADKKGYIATQLSKQNPELDMKEVDITNITDSRAIVVPLNSWKTYTGNVQIFYNFIVSDDGQWTLPDISEVISDSVLGNIKLQYDYEIVPNGEYIKEKVGYLNVEVWTVNLVVTNITRTSATIAGDNEVYSGSMVVTFNTLSVYQLDKERMDEAFKSNWVGGLDRSKASNWNQITNLFIRELGGNTWIGRSSMTFLAFKTAIERHFKAYFGNDLEILGIRYYTDWGQVANYVGPDRFRTSYLEGSNSFMFSYRCKVNNTWTSNYVTPETAVINASLALQDRYEQLKANWYNNQVVERVDSLSEDFLANYADQNKTKLIQKFVNSDKFKSFFYLYRQKRITVDYTGDWVNQIYQQRKLILEITIDNVPNKWFDHAVRVYDEIHFDYN